ncbi:MAG: cysteine rich repeat-containing protein [Candidatus Binatia bacterium]
MKQNCKIVLLLFILSVIEGSGSFVFAQQSPCKADVQKFCQGVEPGRGGIRACLREHKEELSSTCKDHLQTKRAQRKAHRQSQGQGSESQGSNSD